MALTVPRHLFAFDTGTGKTPIGIELVRQKNVKTLVVAPLSVIKPAWITDVMKFAPDLKPLNLWKWKSRKPPFPQRAEFKQAKIVMINYESFRSVQERIQGLFQMVLIDESSNVKNHQAKITTAITEFCEDIPFVYLFSGCPAPNSLMEYFTQARIINPLVFGRYITHFRSKFFFCVDADTFKYALFKHMENELLDKIASIASRCKKHDVLDLPDRTFNIREISLSPEELKVYAEMKQHLVTEIREKQIEASTVAIKLMKLRQITAGFLYDEDKITERIGTSKLTELKNLLLEIGEDQVVIWTQFREEGDTISKMLTEMDRSFVRCDGSTTQDEKDVGIEAFINGDLQYIVAHPKSLAHGVTLVNCTYMIYFSISYSYEQHIQSQDRIYRYGQKNECSYYFLLATGSIDHVIYNALARKEKVSNAVLEHIQYFQLRKGGEQGGKGNLDLP